MTTTLNTDGLPVGIVFDGLEFAVEWGPDSTAVEITYDIDCPGWGGCGSRTLYWTVSREDWDAVVAHVALPRYEHREAHREAKAPQ